MGGDKNAKKKPSFLREGWSRETIPRGVIIL